MFMSLTSSVRNAFFVNVFVRLPLPSRCTEGHLRLVPQANMQSASWKHTLLTRASGNTTASEWCLTHVTEGLFTSFHIGDSLVPYLWSLTQSIRTYLSASQITAEPFHAWSVEEVFGSELSTGHMHVVIGFRRRTADSIENHRHNVVISHTGCIVWCVWSREIRYPVNRDFPPSVNGCPTIFHVPSLWARHSTPVIVRAC